MILDKCIYIYLVTTNNLLQTNLFLSNDYPPFYYLMIIIYYMNLLPIKRDKPFVLIVYAIIIADFFCCENMRKHKKDKNLRKNMQE